ncbi:MAG: hypothetical protein ISP90_08290 [Nevskia sp.]|nr:hypothetical protein [Nevskia sp.]
MANDGGTTITNLRDAYRLAKFLWSYPKDLGTVTPSELAQIVAQAGETLDPELDSPEFWQHLQHWAAGLPPIKAQSPYDPAVERNAVSRAAVGAIQCPIVYCPPRCAPAAASTAAQQAAGWHGVIAALLKQSLDTAGADNGPVSAMLWALAKSLSDQGRSDPAPDRIVALVKRLHPV